MKRILIILTVFAGLILASHSAPATASSVISGKALETMDSGGYTYVLIESGGRKIWVAVPQVSKKIVVGKTVNFKPGMEMQNFESKTMKRTFESIIFSEGLADGPGKPGKQAKPAQAAPSPAQQMMISGKALETMDSGGYTYVRIDSGGKKLWIAVPQVSKKISKGQMLNFAPGAEMQNFESKTLKRKFDRIVFSEKIIEDGSTGPGKTVSAKGKTSAPKAPGAKYTLAEIYKNRASMHHKDVVISGKIVKASPGIMERNWYHLQDGTTDSEKHTLDLVVTSQDEVSIGDEVTVSGVYFNNKDFGAGYKFEAIVENATITKKKK